MREAIELKDPTPMYFAQPLEENLFEWHFTILGPSGTDFEGGLYHGRIILPTEYPMKPPSIILLTVRKGQAAVVVRIPHRRYLQWNLCIKDLRSKDTSLILLGLCLLSQLHREVHNTTSEIRTLL